MNITENILRAAGVNPQWSFSFVNPLNAVLSDKPISNKALAMFLAQCSHESDGFRVLEENLNYRAIILATVWPKRFAVYEGAKPKKDKQGKNIPNKFALVIEKHPQAIANSIYADRMGNGSFDSGDGYKYRGRGLIQLTGRSNYQLLSIATGIGYLENPDWVALPSNALRSAMWFWDTHNLTKYADKDDIAGCTKIINGGVIGLTDRKERYERTLKAINEC